MQDVVIILVVLAIVGAAASYVIKAKRNGKKCIGCPNACNCNKDKCSRNNK